MIGVLRWLFVLTFSVYMWTSVAAAQPESPNEGDGAGEARTLFLQGVEQLRAGHHGTAIELFRRSLDRAPRVPTAFNLGLALRAAERYTEALTLVDEIAEERYGVVDETREPDLARLRVEVMQHLASLEVRLVGAERAELRIDGQRAGTLTEQHPFDTQIRPGRHELTAAVVGGLLLEQEVELDAQSRSRVIFNVTTGSAQIEDTESAKGRVTPWLWIGLAAAVVAGGIVTAVVLTRPGPSTDPVYGRTETLRF